MKKIFLLITGLLFLGQAVAEVSQTSQRRGITESMATAAQPSTVRAARQTVSARSGTPVATPTPVVTARAATKQNVAQSGIGISAAVTNTTVNEECKTKYYGCMDSFCMMENDNGGRCGCSDKKADLDNVLAEIEKLDTQTRNMATTGVEKIGLGAGDKANYVLNTAKSAANEFSSDSSSKTRTKSSLDLSIFDSEPTFGFDDATTAVENADLSLIQDKTGDNLHNATRNICVQQMPECSKDIRMLQMMYAQTIQSDCRSYENYLKKMKTESAKKVQVAEQALRNAALESYESANKWDLGQCVVEMRKCMQDETRGACGNDWTGCVGIVAAENARSGLSSRTRSGIINIEGSVTKISIAASSYDALLSKKPLCESITKNCVNAVSKDKNAVWNAFLREIAPSLKSAELIAESNRRTDCIGNISECFKKGCADTMTDEASFDLCISRPEAMLNICKVQLNECGISTNSAAEAEKSMIWDFVLARLASMRVDSCTKEFKQCIQSEDRCGSDYTQCWGLDYDNIVELCPKDKLIACSKDSKYDQEYLANIVSGVMLSIDNNLLNECQVAVETKMSELCGEDNCSNSFGDEDFGTESLLYDEFNQGRVSITGLLDFSKLTTSSDGKSVIAGEMDGASATTSNQGLKTIADKINRVVSLLTTDIKIKACVEGRGMSQIKRGVTNNARFPNLLDNYIPVIVSNGLETAKKNYNTKLNTFKTSAMVLVKARIAEDKAAGKENICINASVLSECPGGKCSQ